MSRFNVSKVYQLFAMKERKQIAPKTSRARSYWDASSRILTWAPKEFRHYIFNDGPVRRYYLDICTALSRYKHLRHSCHIPAAADKYDFLGKMGSLKMDHRGLRISGMDTGVIILSAQRQDCDRSLLNGKRWQIWFLAPTNDGILDFEFDDLGV